MDTGRGGSVNVVASNASTKWREGPALGRALTLRVRWLYVQLGIRSGATLGVDMRGPGLWFR